MNAAAHGYRLHQRVAQTLREVPPQIFKGVMKLLEQLARDPQSVRNLKGCKKVKGAAAPVFEARIEKDWRLIWMHQPNGEPYLLAIGNHDHIFNSARRLAAQVSLDDSPAVVPDELMGTSTQPAAFERSFELNRPFAKIPDELFTLWNVPADVVPVIRALDDEDGLAGLIGQLPDAPIEAIIDYVRDGTIRRYSAAEEMTAAEVLIETHDVEARLPDAGGHVRSPLGLTRELLVEMEVPAELVPDIMRAGALDDLGQLPIPFGIAPQLLEAITVPPITGVAADHAIDLYAETEQDLEDYYLGDIRRLLLRLQSAQREIVDLPTPAIHFVKGVAGSGKTTVALYRARRLLRTSADARVLLLTFNKTLAKTAAELAEELFPEEERCRLVITHLHGWMSEFLRSRRRSVRLVSDEQRLSIMESVLDELRLADGPRSRILEREPSWFLDEISSIIKARGTKTLDDYLALERAGRTTALAEAGRRVVWTAYESYRAALGDRLDWDDYPAICLEELANTRGGVGYSHVIVDEAQDLSPVSLRLAIALSEPEAPSVLLCADAAQSIYRRGFRWKDIGVSMHGARVHHLRNNYRNTAEILRATNAFLERHPGLREDGEQGALDENTPRHGPLPALVLCSSARGEAETIARHIQRLHTRQGVPFGNMAVVAPWKKRLQYIAWSLRERGIPTSLHSDGDFALAADTVKLSTLHSAKGLEFPVVFVADVNDGVLPRTVESDDEDAVEASLETGRKLLYVGMTRAMQELYVLAQRGRESPFLDEIPRDYVRTVAGA